MPKENFTDTEWSRITQSTVKVFLAVASADLSIVSLAKEVAALKGIFAEAKTKFPNNALVQSVATESEARVGTAPKGAPQPPAPSPAELDAEISAIASLLDQKAPAEASEFKQFLLFVGTQVANASGEGWFGTGKAVSDAEAAYLAKLPSLLKL